MSIYLFDGLNDLNKHANLSPAWQYKYPDLSVKAENWCIFFNGGIGLRDVQHVLMWSLFIAAWFSGLNTAEKNTVNYVSTDLLSHQVSMFYLLLFFSEFFSHSIYEVITFSFSVVDPKLWHNFCVLVLIAIFMHVIADCELPKFC